jgi:crossover junction endodeoxyribonuclease RuvC
VRVVGVDPGSGGALAFLTLDSTGYPVGLECVDIPTCKDGRRTKVDAWALARELDARCQPADEPLAAVIIEQGGVRPQNGRIGAAAFWLGLGEVRGVFAAHFVRLETVSPAGWKAAMRVAPGVGKEASRFRASSIFPRWSEQWALAKQHGRAEAALIALHGANRLLAGKVQNIA